MPTYPHREKLTNVISKRLSLLCKRLWILGIKDKGLFTKSMK